MALAWLWLQPPVSSLLPLAGSPAGALPHPATSTPTHPAGKQQWWFSGTKEEAGGAEASPDPQASTALGLPLVTAIASQFCSQLCALIPSRNRAGTVDSGEEQPLTWRAAGPGIAPAPQPLVRVHPCATSRLLWPGPASRSLSRQTEQWPQQKPPNSFHF